LNQKADIFEWSYVRSSGISDSQNNVEPSEMATSVVWMFAIWGEIKR